MRIRSRRLLALSLTAATALALIVPVRALAQQPLTADPAVNPPSGRCGVRRGGDAISITGTATPGAQLVDAHLRQYDANGVVVGDTDVYGPGATADRVALSPEGNFSGQWSPPRHADAAAVIRLVVTVTNGLSTIEDGSDPVSVDGEKPRIIGARTETNDRMVVTFDEPVSAPEGEFPLDWAIDRTDDNQNNGNSPSSVTGTGDERVLTVGMNNRWSQDDTPKVTYAPPPLRQIYEDCTGNALDAEWRTIGRDKVLDRTVPAQPSIVTIHDKTPSGEANQVSSTDTSPTIAIGNVTNEHDVDVFLETGGDDPGDLDAADTKLAGGTGDGNPVNIELPAFSGDGTYRLYARSSDPSGNVGDHAFATYRLDTKAPILQSATADPQSVLVIFDDALVTGTHDVNDWKISLANTTYPVSAVSGEGNQRTLSAANVPDGAALEYKGTTYADEAGNKALKGSVNVTSNFRDPSTMILDVQPETQQHAPGTSHSFSLRLTDHFGAPVQGFRLGGKVLGGPNAARDLDGNLFTGGGVIGTCFTDASGTCSLSYTSQSGGTDTVLGWIDADNDSVPDEVTGTPEPANASGANDVRTHDTVEATTTGGSTPGPSPSPTPTTPSESPSPAPTTGPSPAPAFEERSVSLQADEGVVDLGERIALGGLVTGSEACRSGAEVRVMRRAGDAAEDFHTTLTDANGAWRAEFRSARNAAYHVEITGGGQCAPATSDEITVKVRAAIEALVVDRRIASGRCARVKGRVAPNKQGAVVWLQQRTAKGWRSIDTDGLSSASRFSFPACFDKAGKKTLRVKWMADGVNAAATSSSLRVNVLP